MLYKWYILPIGGLYATYHLLGESETTIERGIVSFKPNFILKIQDTMDTHLKMSKCQSCPDAPCMDYLPT